MSDSDSRPDRQAAYDRLVGAARNAGVNLEQLHSMLRQVAENEAVTREFLRDTVYGVPDEFLDDLIRLRVSDISISEMLGENDGDSD